VDGDIPVERPETEWTQYGFNITELITKARYTLTCALSRNEYNKVCRMKTTKEIWDLLCINYEGT